MRCNVCGCEHQKKIYESGQEVSITSLCQILNIKTTVYYCENCAHLQTSGINNIDEFYDTNYKISSNSEEEDQLYDIVENKKIFRTEHQVQTLLRKLEIKERSNILDYGAAKGAAVRSLLDQRPDIQVHLFDVTEEYIHYWEKLVNPDRWSIYNLKESWQNSFDLITSFFVLEHIEDPRAFLRNIRNLLKEDGCFYCIVPNVYKNIADFVVVDHINHFSTCSLKHVFESEGFELIEIDEGSHNNAFIVIARKGTTIEHSRAQVPSDAYEEAIQIAAYWNDYADKITQYENQILEQQYAIYGAGFYGTFIYSCIKNTEKVSSFIDQNTYLQGKKLFGIPVLSPEQLPDLIRTVYLGLNPARAKEIVSKIAAWESRELKFFLVD